MNFDEALEKLHRGERVARRVWTRRVYLVFCDDGSEQTKRVMVFNRYGMLVVWPHPRRDVSASDWVNFKAS